MTDTHLYSEIAALPDNLKQEVADFVEFLKFKIQQNDDLSEAHKKLLDDRMASYEESPEQALDWTTVAAKIEQKL